MPALLARDLWENPRYSGRLRAEELYDLVLMATGDEQQAQKAMQARAEARMAHNLEP